MSLANCPLPNAKGFAKTEGMGTNGVLILLEALGEEELKAGGLPARPTAPTGSVLERAIRRGGFRRDQFVLWNTIPTHPFKNYLGPHKADAINWGTPYIREVIDRFKPRVILACGDVALSACAGLGNITLNRGFPIPSQFGIPVIGTLHPAFLRRGGMKYLGVLIHDIKFAVAMALNPITPSFWSPVLWRTVNYNLAPEPADPQGYICYPTEQDAEDFANECERDSSRLLYYDIETPYKHTKDEDATDELDDTQILSIQFSMAPETGIFFPWREPFLATIRRLLASGNPKMGANNWRFDDPKLRAQGCQLNGHIHDLRWLWKHFQPDLSGALQFITSFYAPEMGCWKQFAQARPQWYGIRDVDALARIIS